MTSKLNKTIPHGQTIVTQGQIYLQTGNSGYL